MDRCSGCPEWFLCGWWRIYEEFVVPTGIEDLGGGDGLSDGDLRQLTGVLSDLVRKDPWRYNVHPLLYVEEGQEAPGAQPGPGPNPDEDAAVEDGDGNPTVRKRSRYYRRYPWKRVTRTRGSYDPDVYMCTPSREDVIQLLVGLHRAREGDTGRTINFCNRKRPASSVFTNIRFIG
ncbi:hypothetical protein ONE63_004456 [Megalurothrips usitatus]|uniref:Uncharacterized protein n=1 Tax=Megalurothrips usitatus TaxID=439358 RepID=A0AAV7X697_9NEOP|nr:hypothetical protein ONE63_004456 [Megalurothrips usitatus]